MRRLFLVVVMLAALTSCNKENRCINGKGDLTTVTRDVSEFNSVESRGNYEIYLTKGQKREVKIEAESNLLEEIETNVTGQRLIIKSDRCFSTHKPIKVWITMEDIKDVELNGSGFIRTENRFETSNELNTIINGSGDVKLDVKAPSAIVRVNGSGNFDVKLELTGKLDTRINGSGDIVASGSANDLEVDIDGSGDFHGFDIPVKNANVDISGSGKAEVDASDKLDVHISGSGDVIYEGQPVVNTNISGSGKVHQR